MVNGCTYVRTQDKKYKCATNMSSTSRPTLKCSDPTTIIRSCLPLLEQCTYMSSVLIVHYTVLACVHVHLFTNQAVKATSSPHSPTQPSCRTRTVLYPVAGCLQPILLFSLRRKRRWITHHTVQLSHPSLWPPLLVLNLPTYLWPRSLPSPQHRALSQPPHSRRERSQKSGDMSESTTNMTAQIITIVPHLKYIDPMCALKLNTLS